MTPELELLANVLLIPLAFMAGWIVASKYL